MLLYLSSEIAVGGTETSTHTEISSFSTHTEIFSTSTRTEIFSTTTHTEIFMFFSDELETLNLAVHQLFYILICISTLHSQDTKFISHSKLLSLYHPVRVSLWWRANARNVSLYYPYRQYTNLFIFRFVSQCTCMLISKRISKHVTSDLKVTKTKPRYTHTK